MDTKRSILKNIFLKEFLKNSRGQSTVEYILLFAVVASIVASIFKSNKFQSIFGNEGQFATIHRSEIEYTYRHARMGKKFYEKPNYGDPGAHESYTGRFFGAKEKYPNR